MRIVRLHRDHPDAYACNVYWITGGPDRTNTLVDVGSSHPDNLAALLRQMEGHPKGIGRRAVEQVVLTHAHYDHVGGLPAVIDRFNPEVHAYRLEPGVGHALRDGAWLRLGDKDFQVLHTPGHSEDSICLHCPGTGDLFSGDTLYRISDAAGTYPRCYADSLARLKALGAATVHPGHGEPIREGVASFIEEALVQVRRSLLQDG